MKRILLGLLTISFANLAFAQDQNTTKAETVKPWKLTLSTETDMGLSQETGPLFVSDVSQSTYINYTINIGQSGYAIQVNQPLYNNFIESGVNDGGTFAIGNTEVNLKKASIGKVMPADVNLAAALRVVLPTGKLTPDLNKDGFVTYLAPSITASKSWTQVSLAASLASRFYVYTKEAFPLYTYTERTAKTKDVLIPSYANPITRQILQGIFGYQITDKFGFGTVAQLELDWRNDPGFKKPAQGAPRFMLIPELTFSPMSSVEVATGVVIGGSTTGAKKLRDVWFNNQADLVTSSTAYGSVSYSF